MNEMYVCMYVCMRACVCVRMYVYTHACMHVCLMIHPLPMRSAGCLCPYTLTSPVQPKNSRKQQNKKKTKTETKKKRLFSSSSFNSIHSFHFRELLSIFPTETHQKNNKWRKKQKQEDVFNRPMRQCHVS